MDLDFALLSFDGINSAAEAFATARDRSGGNAAWIREVGFVEHHDNGHLVMRGTFAGHYVDADEALHFSDRGAGEGSVIGAILGVLLGGPPGLAVGVVAGGTIGSQAGTSDESDPEPEPFAERIRAAVPLDTSAIVLIGDPQDVDQLLAAVDGGGARVMRKPLTPDEAGSLHASLSASPAASRGPSLEGEEAVEASESGPAA